MFTMDNDFKLMVCQGATCTCKFGTTPDKLKVKTHSKHYINDYEAKEKLVATHKDIGQTFEKNFFGSCKKLNNNPCKVNVTQWQGQYEKITYEINGGHPLLEDSKATCAIASVPCIDITKHGQTTSISKKQAEQGNKTLHTQINPLVNMDSLATEESSEDAWH